ncbi:FAD-dependent oxidoreductase [uncultured Roseobacter sp.]|uniref:flavin monoamine oxidase family protein n=1 Tax=uncultured Roseobacter sp. TaxID=114847 RepID=UPI002607C6B8|nr:FAD-dependent oxidoreductase [uncultured Roseobacter sp.]
MDTLIIGGGISGLALAEALEVQNHDYLLIEARERFGGRIKTAFHDAGYFDLGPAWFWPGQPRIAALIDRLGLQRFDQFADGVLTFEDERGQVERGRGFASMQGSWRLKGGLEALTQTLAARLPDNRKQLNAPVVTLAHSENGVTATLQNGEKLKARQVVLALPPRVAAQMTYAPALPATSMHAMQGIATWMAGQAKAVAIYDRPFWRDAGLSGDAMSRFGPMVEVHDASPANGGPYALFGFIGIPPQHRTDAEALRRDVTAQLVRLFGKEAATPKALYIKDWAFDLFTATDADKAPLHAHPTYGLPGALRGLWDGKLQFAGTEVAPQFGGYLEGALEAAENVLLTVQGNGTGHAHAD